jgi:excisionase family DNA binding protein
MGHEWYRVGQVARRFDVSDKAVRRWLRAGRLPYVRLLGGQLRIPAAAVEALVGDGQQQVGDEPAATGRVHP